MLDASKRVRVDNEDVRWRHFELVSILFDVEQFYHNFTQVFVSPAIYKRIK